MGTAVSTDRNNDSFVDFLIETGAIKSPIIEKVFRAVDRADYFLEEDRENAYNNTSWKSENLHILAPSVYCEVLEKLDISPGMSFLNLGSGTGYFSTIIGLILGTNGINHGIEIFDDVVQYANSKLEEFLQHSTALDEYEFCKPRFIHGNCLTLSSSTLPYDRVYCGGICPLSYQTYVKNLIKIGGILIMPTNVSFLKIIRTSETSWEEEEFAGNNFTPLLLPIANTVQKFNVEPMSLQEMCRSKIRSTIRQNIINEQESIAKNPLKRPKKKRCVIIPTFEETDLENSRELVNLLNEMAHHSSRNESWNHDEPREISSLVRTGEKRIYIDTESDIDAMDEDEPPSDGPTPWVYASPYTNQMRAKIQELPLPNVLKYYVNMNRELN